MVFIVRMFLIQDSRILGGVFVALAGFVAIINWKISRVYPKGFYKRYFQENLRLSIASAVVFLILIGTVNLGFSMLNTLIMALGATLLSMVIVRVLLLKNAK